ncbi:MAG: outer membrane beta-barrel protein [Pseudomonadota bacterium]
MKRFLKSSQVVLFSLLSVTGVAAADYNSGVVTKTPSGGYTDVEYGSGWYLRGDITINLDTKQETEYEYISSIGRSLTADYEDTLGIKVGFGYIFNPSFRMDLAAEHTFESQFDGLFNVNFSGIEQVTDPATGNTTNQQVTNIPGTETIDANYRASNIMLTGYYDLPTLGRFTPYLGAGLGVSRLEINETRTASCIPNSAQACGSPAAGNFGEAVQDVQTVNSEDVQYLFAYQLTAGTAYALTHNLALDVGYTYFSTGDGDDISYSDGTAINREGFSVHKVNVGLRYEIW